MAMTTNREQLELVKQRISEANQKSHFVIFKSVEHGKQATLRLITDYDSFQIIKKSTSGPSGNDDCPGHRADYG